MKPKNIAFIAFLLFASAIAFGAIGAHAFKETLSPACLNTYLTGARYHMYVSLALLGIAALSAGSRVYFSWSLSIFLLGAIMFIGGCYISSMRETYVAFGQFGSKMAPFGGVFLIISSSIMAVQIYRHPLK